MTIVNYPKLHHLGFKFICTWYVFNSLVYMNLSVKQQAKIIHLLEDIKHK